MTARALADAIIEADRRVVICVGDSDTGKTSLVASLLEELRARGERPVHIDLDMGQSTIGPPTTIGLKWADGAERLYFVGNTSPFGIAGEIGRGLRLFRLLLDAHPGRALVDTDGLVQGRFGRFLKRMEMEALRADMALVIDRAGEASAITEALGALAVDCVLLRPEAGARVRSPRERALYREALFSRYFEKASPVSLSLGERTVGCIKRAPAESGRVVGLLDASGFLLRLGLFLESGEDRIVVLAPRCNADEIRSVRIGRYVVKGS